MYFIKGYEGDYHSICTALDTIKQLTHNSNLSISAIRKACNFNGYRLFAMLL